MFMDFVDFLNGRGEVVIFSTDERNLFPNNLTYGPVVFGSRRVFAATQTSKEYSDSSFFIFGGLRFKPDVEAISNLYI